MGFVSFNVVGFVAGTSLVYAGGDLRSFFYCFSCRYSPDQEQQKCYSFRDVLVRVCTDQHFHTCWCTIFRLVLVRFICKWYLALCVFQFFFNSSFCFAADVLSKVHCMKTGVCVTLNIIKVNMLLFAVFFLFLISTLLQRFFFFRQSFNGGIRFYQENEESIHLEKIKWTHTVYACCSYNVCLSDFDRSLTVDSLSVFFFSSLFHLLFSAFSFLNNDHRSGPHVWIVYSFLVFFSSFIHSCLSIFSFLLHLSRILNEIYKILFSIHNFNLFISLFLTFFFLYLSFLFSLNKNTQIFLLFVSLFRVLYSFIFVFDHFYVNSYSLKWIFR